MIKINQLSKSYFARELFTDVTFQMNAGDRLGLVGRNGHGKSTLFRLILGEEEADSGEIVIPRNYRIGHLEQHLHFTQPTILAEAALGLPEEESHSIYKAEAILFGLGFSATDLEKAPDEFSGGFQIRINLAKLLLSDPNLLLLDEPTNYLDITSVRWIARFLSNFKGELILITMKFFRGENYGNQAPGARYTSKGGTDWTSEELPKLATNAPEASPDSHFQQPRERRGGRLSCAKSSLSTFTSCE